MKRNLDITCAFVAAIAGVVWFYGPPLVGDAIADPVATATHSTISSTNSSAGPVQRVIRDNRVAAACIPDGSKKNVQRAF
jgi:hypothetical protein